MEASGAVTDQSVKQEEVKQDAKTGQRQSDICSKEEPKMPMTKSNKRRQYIPRQKNHQGTTRDSKKELNIAPKARDIESQKSHNVVYVAEGKEDVISWLNKKISKQEESLPDERSLSYGKDKSGEGKRSKSQQFLHQKDKNFAAKEDINEKSKEQHKQAGEVLTKNESEKSKQRPRTSRNRNPNFRSENKLFDTMGSGMRKGKMEERDGDEGHPKKFVIDGPKNTSADDEKLVKIGINVNVVDGKYVERRQKQGKHHGNMYMCSQFQGADYYPQDYYPIYGYSEVYGTPYSHYPPNVMQSNYQYQYYQNLDYNYQGYYTQNQNTHNQTDHVGQVQVSKDEKSKPRSDKQRYQFKGYKKKQMYKDSSSLDGNYSEQAAMLSEQLLNEGYECMVCCDKIRCSAAVWSCDNCYHVFHLKCVRKWARSAMAVVEGEDGGWRCPACQNISPNVPNVYRCFCGKSIDPQWNLRDGIIPHSCGELCKKKREASDCPHLCNQLCHPGPCPSCPVMITKSCKCGKESQQSRCGQKNVIRCKEVCQKPLNCGVHACEKICHSGPCDLCDVLEEQDCYCGATKRQSTCGSGKVDTVDEKKGCFSCGNICKRSLDCGNHTCDAICHKGKCAPCKLKPELVPNCPCGKTTLHRLLGPAGQRQSCLDPIPTCENICGKNLPCSAKQGESSDSMFEHCCKLPCHHGNCGPCDGMSDVMCRCGTTKKTIKCCDKSSEDYLCDQRCNKKRQCGRHRCNQKCCIDKEHKCELICGKKLRCRIHTCEEPCHKGYCPPCLMTGFEELTCHCGATVLFPPIPCGTPPPDCTRPCSRQHSCSHQVNHLCHNEEVCPPCTVLTKKMCNGNHELRYNVPCHVTDVSCSKQCGSPLPCGHKCNRLCHKPPCISSQDPCRQPCEQLRKECGHICGAPCHKGTPCPISPCKVKVKVSCKCGRRSEMVPCLQGGDKSTLAQFYQRLTTEALANKMKEVQKGQTVDISKVLMLDEKAVRHIDCNDECAVRERNRRLAEALHIDESTEATLNVPRMLYSPFLVTEAKSNLTFIQSVEEAFENLIDIAKKSQSGQKSHSFAPMNSNQRRIIHELAVHYNCSSLSYDSEPKRNTVITATKDSKLPPSTLSAQVTRLLNPPAPTPVPFLPSDPVNKARLIQKIKKEEKPKTWSQVPDYFADDFND